MDLQNITMKSAIKRAKSSSRDIVMVLLCLQSSSSSCRVTSTDIPDDDDDDDDDDDWRHSNTMTMSRLLDLAFLMADFIVMFCKSIIDHTIHRENCYFTENWLAKSQKNVPTMKKKRNISPFV